MAPEYEISFIISAPDDASADKIRKNANINPIYSEQKQIDSAAQRKLKAFDKNIKRIMVSDPDLTPDEISNKLDATTSEIYGSIYRLVKEDKIPRFHKEAHEETLRSSKKIKITSKTRADVYKNKKELVTSYLEGHGENVVKINYLRKDLQKNGIKISKKCVQRIVNDLNEEGKNILTYKIYHKEAKAKDRQAKADLKVRKNEIIAKVNDMYKRGLSPVQMRRELNFSNDGVISIAGALHILRSRGEIKPYKRKRTREEVELTDNLIVELYNKNAPPSEIKKNLRLDNKTYDNSIARLKSKGIISGRKRI